MKKRTKKQLGNPALIAAVASNPELVKTAGDTANKLFRTLLIGGVCVGGFFIGRKIYKKIKGQVSAGQEAGSTINAILTSDEAMVLANKLYSAMKGIGTNLPKIKEAFQACFNEEDVNLVIKKFGSRDDMTLSQWINDDISIASDREKYINSVLRAKGISKQF